MCTLVILRRPQHQWPLIIGANRDELITRKWESPARHWEDHPQIIAGIDKLAGGTWLGINDDGVLATVLNRIDSLGPVLNKRSRGELPLNALDHANARSAAKSLSALDSSAYGTFNMIIADNLQAYWLKNDGITNKIIVSEVPVGISMITAQDINDETNARIQYFLPQFKKVSAPDPDYNDWADWENLLKSPKKSEGSDFYGAMAIHPVPYNQIIKDTQHSFGTVCSSLIAVPSNKSHKKPIWRFAKGISDNIPFKNISLRRIKVSSTPIS